MKKQLIFLTFVFSLVSAFGAYMTGNWIALLGWATAAMAAIDHFNTLKHF